MDGHPTEQPTGRKEGGTQSIDRALAILFAFTAQTPERRIVDLTRELGLNKSTVYRLLQALAGAGLVRRNPASGAYRLAGGVMDLAERFLAGIDLRAEARPLLEGLVAEHGESVNLAIRDGTDAISVDYILGPVRPQLISHLGRRIPIYCSGAGKALILDRSDADLRSLFGSLAFKPFTPHTITEIEAFLADLRAARRRGWAMNDEETEIGMRAIAAPAYDHSGAIVASISISGPVQRIGDERVPVLAAAVGAAAAELTVRIGGRQPISS